MIRKSISRSIKHSGIYLECLLRNIGTLSAVLILVAAIIIGFLKGIPYAIPLLFLDYYWFKILNYGRTSYWACKKAFRIMKDQQMFVQDNGVYCVEVGNRIAERRFKKLHPIEYTEVERKRSLAKAYKDQYGYSNNQFEDNH